MSAGGEYLAEVSRGRVLSLVPQRQWGAALTPVAEERLRVQYLEWCQKRGGGDCLGLFEDGAFFLTDDKRVLALDSVLDEMPGGAPPGAPAAARAPGSTDGAWR